MVAQPSRASAGNNPQDIGTINADSGNRLGGPLTGIDIPTLRDVWATAPYLHRGSAATVGDAIQAHNGVSLTAAELTNLVAYVSQIGGTETTAPGGSTPGTGTGLTGRYFNNTALSGTHVLQRIEAVDFKWTGSPGAGVNGNQFSARWTGQVEATATGNFRFQTRSDDGVRLWINGSSRDRQLDESHGREQRDRHNRAHRRTRSTRSRWSSTRTPGLPWPSFTGRRLARRHSCRYQSPGCMRTRALAAIAACLALGQASAGAEPVSAAGPPGCLRQSSRLPRSPTSR